MRQLPVLLLVIVGIASNSARAGVGADADPSENRLMNATAKTLQHHQSFDGDASHIRLVGHDEITRLPPTQTGKEFPKTERKATVQKSKTSSLSPPGASSKAELPIELFQPKPPSRSPQVENRARQPVCVENLDFEPLQQVVPPAANDHDRLAAENLRVSPLSGVHDFEQPMDVMGMTDEPVSDAPLTEAERSSLSLSAEVRTQATRMLVRAEQLANRGAVFAAKEEFVRALRMVTRSLDADIGRSYHSRCLARGLQALEEADDFTSQSRCVETDTDLRGFIAGHETSVLHDSDSTTLTPLIAMRHYYDYAHDQLTKAGAESPVAAKALFAVGRAHSRIRKASTEGEGAPKSLAFYNAALAIDPNNAQAANELAVLLAQTGHLDHAASVLHRSAQVAPSSIGLQNLAHIYQQMGQVGVAQQVASTRQKLIATPGSLTPTAGQPHQQIAWVSPQTFNQAASAIDENPSIQKTSDPATARAPNIETPSARSKGRSSSRNNGSSGHWW